jgi:hypothetical protein
LISLPRIFQNFGGLTVLRARRFFDLVQQFFRDELFRVRHGLPYYLPSLTPLIRHFERRIKLKGFVHGDVDEGPFGEVAPAHVLVDEDEALFSEKIGRTGGGR